MPKQSAGLLMYRRPKPGSAARTRGAAAQEREVEVFLVHPGGPFWAKKDEGAWSIPKGEYDPGEDPLAAARREFQGETGCQAADAAEGFHSLGSIKQPSGKTVAVWAVEGDCEPAAIQSNAFTMEWPPKSGKTQEFPEVDRAGWFSIEEARKKILKGQAGFLDQLLKTLAT